MKNNNLITFALASTLCVSAWIGISAFTAKNESLSLGDKMTKYENIGNSKTANLNNSIVTKNTSENFEMTEKGKKLIKDKLTIQLRRVVYGTKKGRVKEFMSRCPSGVHDNIMKQPLTAGQFFYGEVRQYDGCAEKLLCEFRMSSDESTLQVWDSANKTFASVEKWIPAQTQAKLSRGKERELAHLYEETEKEQAAEGKH